MRTLVASLFFTCAVHAAPQADAVGQVQVVQIARHGLAGAKPGTERWIVTFKERSFDLSELRSLSSRHASATEVDPVVARYERQARTDQARFTELVDSMGGRVIHHWWLVNCCAIELDPARLTAVADLPNVLKVDPDEEVLPQIADCTSAANHNSDYANAVLKITGAGVTTAVVDSGLDENMNGTGRPHRSYYVNGDPQNLTGGGLKGSRLLVNRKIGVLGPDAVTDHGTGVSGIIMGFKWSAGGDSGHAPDAKVVGYCIANDTAGNSSFSTVISAWQAVAADKAAYRIQTACNAYGGSQDPTHPSQMALDSCAFNADVLIVVPAGNANLDTSLSQSGANGLAVGACYKTPTRRIIGSSVKGPLLDDTTRSYPDIAAIGVSVIMPKRDDEAGQYSGSGTSFAAANVCGAASLVRSARPGYSALDAKAILLLTAEDIAAQNPTGNRNSYGLGFVRSDRSAELALNGNAPINNQLTTSTPRKTFPLPVTGGKTYGVVLAWERSNFAARNWSDLNLRILDAANHEVRASATPRNLYERVNFLAATTATYQIEVDGASLDAPSVAFSVVYGEVPLPYLPGVYSSFGTGCPGGGYVPGNGVVFPRSVAATFGILDNVIPLAWTPTRYQQVFDGNDHPAFVALGMGFRQDDQANADLGLTVDMEVRMGVTTLGPTTLTNTFASNFDSGPPIQVLSRKNVVLPNMPLTLLRDPTYFFVDIPFDVPFPFANTGGVNPLLEIVQYGHSRGSTIWVYRLDFAVGTATSRVVGANVTNPTGDLYVNGGLVTCFRTMPGGAGAIPLFTNTGYPEIARTFTLNLRRAAPRRPYLLFTGFSRTSWNGLPLPFDLGAAGAAGCSLLVAGNVIGTGVTDQDGASSPVLAVPQDAVLIGAQFYNQFVIHDPVANALQVVTTHGGEGRIGGQL